MLIKPQCGDAITKASHIPIAGDLVCEFCVEAGVVPLFQTALESEFAYPPTYGATIFDIGDFYTIMGEAFAIRYRRVQKEYDAPMADRIYCTNQIRARGVPRRGSPAATSLYLRPVDIQSAKEGQEIITCGACLFASSRP